MKDKAKIGSIVKRVKVPFLNGTLLITKETCDRYAVWYADHGCLYEIEDVSDDLMGAELYIDGFLEGVGGKIAQKMRTA